jgi:CBS domain containing-hemolysin-like protein
MLDIHILAGLATLIVLELVLGIDNLVFIAILANKLPPHQRDRARVTGLVMAMAMRLGLLAVMSHIAALTDPVVGIAGRGFSPRDIILILGGVFLVYKATREIHEKLEGHHASQTGERRVPTLTATLVQIVALDAIFSLDSIITAVGMVEDLWVMMAAVVISMGIMVAASKPLTSFVSKRPTVIILCLSFLLLIGCSLIADGFGFHVPKTYLYAAIGFSLLIESLNQVGGLKHRRKIMDKPIRERTADAILRLMVPTHEHDHKDDLAPPPPIEAGGLHDDETDMIKGVISLGSLTARSIMTLRPDIVWVDANRCGPDLIDELLASGRTRVLLCDGALDDVIGVVEVRDAFRLSHSGSELDLRPLARTPLYVQEQMVVIDLVGRMRRANERFAVVIDEVGAIEGIVTTTDIFAEIGGDLADDEDEHLIERSEDGWLVDGMARMSDMEKALGVALGDDGRDYETVSGHILHRMRNLPEEGDSFEEAGWTFEVVQIDGRRIAEVAVRRTGQGEE